MGMVVLPSSVDHGLLELARAVQRKGYRFVTPTPSSHTLVNARPANAWARDLRGVFGWSQRFDPVILPDGLFSLMEAAKAVVQDGEGWRSLYRLSTIDELLFVHSAYPTTSADAVFLGPDTYRFIAAMQHALAAAGSTPWRRAADIGCGSGAAGIVLACGNPAADVVMTDINPEALRLSAVNLALAKTRAITRRGNLLDGIDGTFDLIVANPPYLLDPSKRLYRHGGGARGEGVSLAIVDVALERLAPGGRLFLYTGSAIVDGGDPLLAAVTARLGGSAHHWSYREIDPDVFGEELAHLDAERIAAVFLTLTKVME